MSGYGEDKDSFSVELRPDQKNWVFEQASQTGKSQGEVIRDALDRYRSSIESGKLDIHTYTSDRDFDQTVHKIVSELKDLDSDSIEEVLRVVKYRFKYAYTINLYLKTGSSVKVAEELGITFQSVWNRLKKAGIEADSGK